jgi:hypothetical protein
MYYSLDKPLLHQQSVFTEANVNCYLLSTRAERSEASVLNMSRVHGVLQPLFSLLYLRPPLYIVLKNKRGLFHS